MSWSDDLQPLRIIARRSQGHWNAWFAGWPQEAYGGDSMTAAVERLLDAHPERDIDRATLTKTLGTERHGHMEFSVSLRSAATCSECQGSGQYVGLQIVEVCRTCGGSGKASQTASNWITTQGH